MVASTSTQPNPYPGLAAQTQDALPTREGEISIAQEDMDSHWKHEK